MEIFKLFGSIVIKDEEAIKKLDSIDKIIFLSIFIPLLIYSKNII